MHSRPPAFSEKATHLTKGVSRCRFDRFSSLFFSSLLFFFFFFSGRVEKEGGGGSGRIYQDIDQADDDSENDLKAAAMAFGHGIAHIDDLINGCP